MATPANVASASLTGLLLSVGKSPGIRWAISGWAFFIAENAILSENRTWLIEDVFGGDENMYRAVYGTFSTAATGSIAYSYFKLNRMSQLIAAPHAPLSIGKIFLSWCATSLGLIMMSQAAPTMQIPLELYRKSIVGDIPSTANETVNSSGAWSVRVRCPFDFSDRKAKSDESAQVSGLERITRHPGLWSLAFLGAGNAVWQPTVALSVWMMGPTSVAWLGGNHNDSRYRRGIGGTMDVGYASVTSNIPFAAILLGKQGNALSAITSLSEEIKPLNATLATVLATLWIVSKGRSQKFTVR